MEPIFGTWLCLELSEKKWLPAPSVEGGLEGLAHQLIRKQQRDAVHLFFLVGQEKEKKNHRHTWFKIGFLTLCDRLFLQRICWSHSAELVVAFASSQTLCIKNSKTLGETWSLDYVTLKATCRDGDQTLHARSVSILLFRLWVMRWIINAAPSCMNIISGWKVFLFWHNGGNFTFYTEKSSFLPLWLWTQVVIFD